MTEKKENLVQVSTFAKLTGQRTQKVYQWIQPQRIVPKIQDKKPFIDLNKYNPEDFKK